MPEFEIRRYDPTLIEPDKANWKVDGNEGNWGRLVDPEYGAVNHVVVVKDGVPLFDKLDIEWRQASYVLPVRINPDGKAEFLIPEEQRILLRDQEGQQGNVKIRNITQGMINEGESPSEAALREVREETGYDGQGGLVYLGSIALTPANSQTLMPFFMAVVHYEKEADLQQLDESESITVTPWLTLQEIRRLGIIDGSTRIGLDLATQCIKQDLLQ